ncbi:hypothetical protein OUZ56_031992 [Daphnia magna]|uniref:Uncharacterized protein n=1 Tax=Daphnia magna TaxID=35525 RepID=A0ABQ9ZW81_9CRUS|nr:hypothetical protein OUZ56_031992 [Daphnia magna]
MAAKRRCAVAGCQVMVGQLEELFFAFERWNLKSDAKPKHLLNLDQPVPTRGLKSFRQPFQERPNDNHKGKTLVHRNNVKQGLQTKTFYQCGPRALKIEVGHAGGSSWSCLSLQRKDKETVSSTSFLVPRQIHNIYFFTITNGCFTKGYCDWRMPNKPGRGSASVGAKTAIWLAQVSLDYLDSSALHRVSSKM